MTAIPYPQSGPFAPYSASLDQILQLLSSMALSPAFEAEVQNYKQLTQAAQPQKALIVDAYGIRHSLSYAPVDPAMDYLPDRFAQASTTPMQKVLPPFPVCELVGMPGRVQTSNRGGERFINLAATGEIFTIDIYTWAGSSDDPRREQMAAMTLAMCMKSLIRRNEQLNGLVQLIQATGPVEALGSPPHGRADSMTQVARARHESYVLTPG